VGRGSEPPGNDVWGGLGECESGNANVDTGNGYSGYFQFSDATWRSMGTGYARAVDAPYAVQLDAAQRLQARSGWGQWPACSRSMGLR
jgi:resuscitation-promoting factor RpfB